MLGEDVFFMTGADEHGPHSEQRNGFRSPHFDVAGQERSGLNTSPSAQI